MTIQFSSDESIIVIRDTIRDYFSGMKTVKRFVSGKGIRESIPETPIGMIYLDSYEVGDSGSDRRTFGGTSQPLRKTTYTFKIDVYVSERKMIGEETELVDESMNEIDGYLKSITGTPFFNLQSVKAFTYRVERNIIEYAKITYSGYTVSLTIVTF